MNEVVVASREALWVVVQIGGPLLILLLIVGLSTAIFQALTQINEATLGFLPKIIVLGVALMIFSPFFVGVLRGYAGGLFRGIVDVGLKG